MENLETMVAEFVQTLLQINRIKAAEIFERCHLRGNSFEELEKLTVDALVVIGDGWENGTVSLSQVYMGGVICEELIDQYLPKTETKRKDIPRMAIAVLLDHHALGKRIVYSVLRSAGFEVLDFGQGLSVESLIAKTIESEVEILLVSTLMLPSALKVKEVISTLKAQGCKVKVIVGGAPFRLDPALWQAVGADADGKNASSVIQTIENLLKGESAQ